MTVSFLILLAIVWGIFGLWGFLRGWKSALVMLVLIVGSLLLLSIAPERVAAMFDYINKAVAMVTGGNKDFINTAPSSLVVIMLNGAVILGFLVGLLRIFRTKPSFSGLPAGLHQRLLLHRLYAGGPDAAVGDPAAADQDPGVDIRLAVDGDRVAAQPRFACHHRGWV